MITTLQKKIETLNSKQFISYILSFLMLIIILSGVLIYRYYRTIQYFKKQISFINQKRSEVKDILERYESVKKQQGEVDELLAKDKDFVIAGYFTSLIQKLNIEKNKTREPETSSEDLDNGYTERRLYATFSNLNMQKVAELLDIIEQSERIYTKELEIYKPTNDPSVNVNLLIATLEPKIEQPIAEE